ncbi:prefoldin subunit 5-like [Dysidea avara]|uniref:prefoldin subunit 5-like n=1 Tax=Dysidea avara TaxID=196820 RepID=UPI00332E74A3
MSEVSSTVSGGESNVVNLSELNFTQLDQLRNQVQQEIAVLQSSMSQLKEIQQRLKDSKENAALLTPDTEGKDILVPLTASMYIPGKLKHNNKVMVDIGTGYYVEKSVKEAKEYFQRRMDHITKQIEVLQPTAAEKVKLRETIMMLMQAKFQAHLQQSHKSK